MLKAPHILVVDDEVSIRTMLQAGLTLKGFTVTAARTGNEALERTRRIDFDAVLCDLYMPDGGGFEVVRELRTTKPDLPIILMTAQGSVETAVEAIARGATDFIGKPFEIATVAALLRRYVDARTEVESTPAASAPNATDLSKSGLVGRSAPMVIVYKLIAQAAQTDATVLITGESGTGKELAARAIHDFSARRGRPFLTVNCAGLTDTLLESELFGHMRGAFTGAHAERAGLFEAAEGGTLFLDELASTSPAFQASLLRVLQSGEVRRVGSTQTRKANVRVTGASNAPLRDLMAAGSFRADLYYRLSVLAINLPPLRERGGDVELLTAFFLERLAGPRTRLILTREAMEALNAHEFPGNVRELENALLRAAALSSNGLITIGCLPPEIAGGRKPRSKTDGLTASAEMISDRPTMEELERRYLKLILDETGWNRRRSAAVLGLDRRTVQRLIARYKLHGTADLEGELEMDIDDDPDERPTHQP